jgi:Uma2 family endonuclease
MSLDEFLAWEREQPERHEFDGFTITAMTGASMAHVTITMNLAFALRQGLRGTGCRPLSSDAKVIAGGSVRYPDVAVTCQPIADRDDIVPEPVLIIEVISPSTERVDRGRKKLDYFATPSVRQYAMVEQDDRLVDLYTRSEAGWINEVITGDSVLKLSSIAVELTLDTIYEDTELDATRRQAGGEPVPAA